MTTHLPPATSPSAKTLRIIGAVAIVTTPITGLISYALSSTVLSEERLEGPTGLTALGWTTIALPAFVGLALVAASFTGIDVPMLGRRSIGGLLLVAAGLFAGVGVWSSLSASPGDASIGGGLLVLAALPTVVAGLICVRPLRSTAT